MTENAEGEREKPLASPNVFADTCVLLNYIQREIERDVTSTLVESPHVDLFVGVTVREELDAVSERRQAIYPDLIDFLLEDDASVDEYDPTSRSQYFQSNDLTHIYQLQNRLSELGERAEVMRHLRRFMRMVERRLEYLKEEVLSETVFEQQPGLSVMLALHPVISNDNDRKVVGDAALWTAEGGDSSGVFVTMDSKDLLDVAADINAALRDARDERWELTFTHPAAITIDGDRLTVTLPETMVESQARTNQD